MSDTNINGSAPEESPTNAVEQTEAVEAKPKHAMTRRQVLAMAGCGVAGLVVGGVLASWGVTSQSIASGRIDIRHTATKMIVTDRARCSGCQRCEMMCTLKNDGRVCQNIARVRVWDNYNWGTSPDTGEGSFGDGNPGACEFTVEHCKQCADAWCMKYCPVHACARRLAPGTCLASIPKRAFPRSASPAAAAQSSAPTVPSSSSIGKISRRSASTWASFARPRSSLRKRRLPADAR